VSWALHTHAHEGNARRDNERCRGDCNLRTVQAQQAVENIAFVFTEAEGSGENRQEQKYQ
jgi:hypothetical protein